MKVLRFIITVLLIITAGMAVVQITASNMLATDGIDLGHIQQQIADVKKENVIIREKIYTVGALTHVASVAAQMGFVPEKSAVFIPSSETVAIR